MTLCLSLKMNSFKNHSKKLYITLWIKYNIQLSIKKDQIVISYNSTKTLSRLRTLCCSKSKKVKGALLILFSWVNVKGGWLSNLSMKLIFHFQKMMMKNRDSKDEEWLKFTEHLINIDRIHLQWIENSNITNCVKPQRLKFAT